MSKTRVALQDLFVPGGEGWAAAHRKGEEVPYDTDEDKARVERGGWDELLAAPGTKAAAEATGQERPKPRAPRKAAATPKPATPIPDSSAPAVKEQ